MSNADRSSTRLKQGVGGRVFWSLAQIFPFHSELRKNKITTLLRLPRAAFLSPPTVWDARDQPEPGSFFPRVKGPGNEVGSEKLI